MKLFEQFDDNDPFGEDTNRWLKIKYITITPKTEIKVGDTIYDKDNIYRGVVKSIVVEPVMGKYYCQYHDEYFNCEKDVSLMMLAIWKHKLIRKDD